MGYSCVPVSKDEDGFVVLLFNRKESDVRALQQQLVESLHKFLGSNQTLTVNVDVVKALPNDQYVRLYCSTHGSLVTFRRDF